MWSWDVFIVTFIICIIIIIIIIIITVILSVNSCTVMTVFNSAVVGNEYSVD